MTIQNSIQSGTASSNIIIAILDFLLTREKEKVINGLKERWEKKYPEFACWDKIYSSFEQSVYIACYVLFSSIDFSLYTNNNIPSHMQVDYTEAIRGFVTQHPFIQSVYNSENSIKEFTGPAFRDYILSQLLSDETYGFLAVEYFTNHQSLSHCPSQLLFDFYKNTACNQARSNIIPYLYDSLKARETNNSSLYLRMFSDDDEVFANFYLIDNQIDSVITDDELQIELVNNSLYFRNIANAEINVSNDVLLGENKSDARIFNSSVICKQLILNASNIVFEGNQLRSTLIVSREPIRTSEGQYTKIITIGDELTLKISAPNVQTFHALKRYAYRFEDDDSKDALKFTHAVRKIIGCLRKHSKDVPARDKEFIDNIIVGSSIYCKGVLAFMLQSHILYVDDKEPFLYKLDIETSRQLGISWGQLSLTGLHSLDTAYEYYSNQKK